MNNIKSIDFWQIDEQEALILMKSDYRVFSAAMIEMMKVDNFDNFLPSGLRTFSSFYYDNHKFIYENHGNFEIIYFEFLKWIEKDENIF
ncbi:MAG: hypothetical protein ACFE96_08085 [Candidatus Hermodarchaeota archaeon]